MEFYDKLGAKYDRMTNAKKRAERESPFFQKLVEKNNIQSAVDIGCGTGQHVRILAEMGIQVTGIDPSEEFLSIAQKNLREYDSQIMLEKGDLLSVSKFVKGPVDAVFCIGNTLPHVLTEDDLISGMNSVREILAPEGIVVLHVLNYSKILNKKRRIVNATKDGKDIFTRFYDFIDPLLRFNILVLHDENDHLTPELLNHW